MALSPVKITPVLDPNCLDTGDAASEVYPPLATTTTLANDVGAGEQILRNQTHTLNEVKVDIAGDTMTGLLTANAGITVASGQILALDGVNITGQTGFSALGRVLLYGRKGWYRNRAVLTDADQTVSVNDGDGFDLSIANAAPRTITLDSTTYVPVTGETLTFFWFPKTAAVGGGVQYTIRRSTGVTIAEFSGSTALNTGLVWAEFEYQGGVWRLGKNSGTLHDGAGYYGVIGGAGA